MLLVGGWALPAKTKSIRQLPPPSSLGAGHNNVRGATSEMGKGSLQSGGRAEMMTLAIAALGGLEILLFLWLWKVTG